MLISLPFFWLFAAFASAHEPPSALRILDFDAISSPIDSRPRFSWVNNFDGADAHQGAYHIVLSDRSSTVWDSGKVRSDFQVGVPYEGPSLEPATKYSWKVRTWGRRCQKDKPNFSSPMTFTTGFFSLDQWSNETQWIAAPQKRVGLVRSWWISAPSAVHKSFSVPDKDVVSAQTSVTATSPFVLSVNGAEVLNSTAIWSANVTDIDLKSYITPGSNNISIFAPGGADGVILRSEVRTQDDGLILVTTDNTWTIPEEEAANLVAPYYEAPWATWKILTTGGTVADSPQMLRREFNTSSSIVSATLFIAGLGQFEAYLNDEKIGPYVTNQAWTDFDFRTTYTSYDVTDHILEAAPNVLGVQLASGWFDYQTKSVMQRWGMGEAGIEYIKSYGVMRLRCELHMQHGDGATQIISSDNGWKSSSSAWTFTNVYGSEDYNFQREQPGWAAPGFDDAAWTPVNRIDPHAGELRSQRTPSIKVHESFPGTVHSSGPGYVIYDIGTNINGQIEITTVGDRALTYDIVPGENVVENRVSPIGNARNDTASASYITYSKVTTAGTNEPETFRQTFSTAGFRYIEIQAIGSDPLPDITNITGHFAYADAPPAGRFESSDTTYNDIYALARQTLLSNFISIHTDCPTFEKLGWQEVVANLGRSYSFLVHSQPWMARVLSTTRESQRPNGLIPNIAPDYTQGVEIYLDAPSWGHSIIQAPYHLYRAFGDVQALRDNYSAAEKYYAYLKSKAVNGLVTHGLGDWVSPSGTQVSNVEGAVYVNAAATMAAIASVLDAQSDVDYYTQQLEYTKKAYNTAYLSADNCSYTPSVQANQAVPFAYDFLPDELIKCAGEALVDIIGDPVHSNSTGFGDILPDHIATGENALLPLINALHKINRDDLTEKMISQISRPSFRGLVLADQSTLPEQWNYESARSLNHDMFATIMEWFYTSVGGITEVTPGFKDSPPSTWN